MSNELGDLLKTYNEKIKAMEERIAFLEKLEASTSGSPPPDAVLYTPQVESGARQLVARTNIGAGVGDMPLVSPAVLNNLVLQNADGTLKDAGYGVSQGTATAGSVPRRDGNGRLVNSHASGSNEAIFGQAASGIGVRGDSNSGSGGVFTSTSGSGGISTSTSGTYHHQFGSNSAIARLTGALTFLGASAVANRAAQRVALGFEEATAKATPIDADSVLLIDSAAGNELKRTTWANIKATLQTAFSALYVLKAGDTMTGTLNLPSNGLVAGTNQLVISGGNVGIGTALPTDNLQIVPSGGNRGITVSGATNPAIQLQKDAGDDGILRLYDVSGVENARLRGRAGDQTNWLQGRLGLGTTSPSAKLHTLTTAALVGQIIQLAASQTADALQVQSSAAAVLMRVEANGVVRAAGYKSSDGSAGWTGTFLDGSGDTVTVKNGLITDVS